MCSSDIFLGLIAILFPPVAVWVKSGICSADSLINVCLCMLGFLPGLIHAWYIIAKYPDPSSLSNYESVPQDPERNDHITYYYVNQQQSGGEGPGQRPIGYGTNERMHPQPKSQRPERPVGGENGGESGSGGGVPPSYQEAVRADNKVQTHE
ncbi:MAG: hypothetical protein M1827_002321 [Pycnora praestabilis]|nr:MAG: hypothetical protein M1827_002321 [Pycnora praestabilis]